MAWQTFLETERTELKPEFFYLAQIALEIRRSNSKHPGRYKLKDFMFDFTKDTAPKATAADAEGEAVIKKSKAAWATVLGVSLN